MEYIEGPTFNDIINNIIANNYINELKEKHWKNQEEIIKNVINPLIRGLRCLHNNNITHRDIKPANIIYDIKLNKAKLIDFGLSCIDYCNNVAGTERYMAPEVFNMKKQLASDLNLYDINDWKKADIYSFGLTLYNIITGKNPGKRETIIKDLDSIKNEFGHIYALLVNILVVDSSIRLKNWNKFTTDDGLNENECIEFIKTQGIIKTSPQTIFLIKELKGAISILIDRCEENDKRHNTFIMLPEFDKSNDYFNRVIMFLDHAYKMEQDDRFMVAKEMISSRKNEHFCHMAPDILEIFN